MDMRPMAIVPRSVTAIKPKYGQPCNRCGLCCIATLCPIGEKLFQRRHGPCPALEPWQSEEHPASCGVITDLRRWAPVTVAVHGEQKTREAASYLIGEGIGCDARINGEPADPAVRARYVKYDKAPASRLARMVWGL